MLRNTFLLALLVSAANAVKLSDEEDCPEEILASEIEGPAEGFPDELCEEAKPAEYYDPVCYEGEWIEFAWLDEPTFWACGKKPEDKQYATCDIETGQWEELDVYTALDDAGACGDVPDNGEYVVCNHESGEWE